MTPRARWTPTTACTRHLSRPARDKLEHSATLEPAALAWWMRGIVKHCEL